MLRNLLSFEYPERILWDRMDSRSALSYPYQANRAAGTPV